MKWSEHAWTQVAGIYSAILSHPFVCELAAGTLPRHKFMFYLGQDAHYLNSYTMVLAHLASRLPYKDQVESFLKFASEGIAVERALHESFLCGMELPPVSPACMMYTSVEKSMAYEDVAVEAAALLPCFWIYRNVGRAILETAGDLSANPYARWIQTYGDTGFDESTERAIEICDRLADESTAEVRKRMYEVFSTCCRLEWMFWDSAYNLEKWKI